MPGCDSLAAQVYLIGVHLPFYTGGAGCDVYAWCVDCGAQNFTQV